MSNYPIQIENFQNTILKLKGIVSIELFRNKLKVAFGYPKYEIYKF